MKLFLILASVSLSFSMNSNEDDSLKISVAADNHTQQILPEVIFEDNKLEKDDSLKISVAADNHTQQILTDIISPDIDMHKTQSICESVLSPTRDKDDAINTSSQIVSDQLPSNIKLFNFNIDNSGDGILIFKIKDVPLKINQSFLREMLKIDPAIDFDKIGQTSTMRTCGGIIAPLMVAEFQNTKSFKYREVIACPEYGLNAEKITFNWNEISCKNIIILPLTQECPVEKIIISPTSEKDSIVIDGKIDFSKPLDDMIDQLKIIHGGMIVVLKEEK